MVWKGVVDFDWQRAIWQRLQVHNYIKLFGDLAALSAA